MNYSKLCAFLTVLSIFSTGAIADEFYEGLIETRILDFDPQSGVKSHHFFFVDFDEKSVTSSYETGSTEFFGVNLSSVRDNFFVSDISFSDDMVTFTLSGSTASGVGFIPNIDYEFDVVVDRSGSVKIEGCHDGYPAYLVQFNGTDLHNFEHQPKEVIKLFGRCDVNMSVSN